MEQFMEFGQAKHSTQASIKLLELILSVGMTLILLASLLVLTAICFYLLAIVCDEFFIPALDELSARMKLSSDVAGATLMAMGSSAPELAISILVLLLPISAGESNAVGAGTIVGSAVFNILVITGASSLYKEVKLNWQPVVRDLLFYSLTVGGLLLVIIDGTVTLWEALGLVGLYMAYLVAVFKWRAWFPYPDPDPIELTQDKEIKYGLTWLTKRLLSFVIPAVETPAQRRKNYLATFALSIVVIAGLSYVLVESAVGAAQMLNISPAIIALTLLAAGTSVPDFISSVLVAKQGRGDMAVSNAVGSNIFNILIGLGAPWLVVLAFNPGNPIEMVIENIAGSIFLLFATIIAFFVLLWAREWKLGPKAGYLLIALYGGYLIYSISLILLQ